MTNELDIQGKIKNWERAADKRCRICGFRIRGANHDNGSHHRAAVAKLKAANQKRV